MKRMIYIIIFIIILISGGFFEIIAIKNLNNQFNNKIIEIEKDFNENTKDIKNNIEKVKKLKNWWNEQEKKLYLIFNYKEFNNISYAIINLETYTKQNDYNYANIELQQLKEYSIKNKENLGFNIKNII